VSSSNDDDDDDDDDNNNNNNNREEVCLLRVPTQYLKMIWSDFRLYSVKLHRFTSVSRDWLVVT